MPKVVFVKEKKEIEVPAGAVLRTAAMKEGITVNHMLGSPWLGRLLNCRGLGTCGTCHVLVKKGMENLSAKGIWEKIRLATMMSAIGHENEIRLACQTRVNGDCTIETGTALNLVGENFWQKPYPNK